MSRNTQKKIKHDRLLVINKKNEVNIKPEQKLVDSTKFEIINIFFICIDNLSHNK